MSPHDNLFYLLFYGLGLLTGFVLGALGSGGSILAQPAFLYAAGLPVKSSVATSLAVVGATSLVGAVLASIRCRKQGCPGQEVDTRMAALFALGSLPASYGGTYLARYLDDRVQLLLLACVMLGAAVGMLRRQDKEGETPAACPERPLWFIPLLGAGVGLLTGVIGVGGGFLIVPALTLLAGVPVKRAASTSLWIIAVNSATGLLGYVGRVPIAWTMAGLFLILSVIGIVVGQRLSHKARPRSLKIAFAVFLVLIGGYTVTKTLITKSTASSTHTPPPAR
jgi:uncharacterized membrane protein YfcA